MISYQKSPIRYQSSSKVLAINELTGVVSLKAHSTGEDTVNVTATDGHQV